MRVTARLRMGIGGPAPARPPRRSCASRRRRPAARRRPRRGRPARRDPRARPSDRRSEGRLPALRLPRRGRRPRRLRHRRRPRVGRRRRRVGAVHARDQRQPAAEAPARRDRHRRRHAGRHPRPPRAGDHGRAAVLRRRGQRPAAAGRPDLRLGGTARPHPVQRPGLAVEPSGQRTAPGRDALPQLHARGGAGPPQRALRRLAVRRGQPPRRAGGRRLGGGLPRIPADAFRVPLGGRRRQGGGGRPPGPAARQRAREMAPRRLSAAARGAVGIASLALSAAGPADLAGDRRVRRARLPTGRRREMAARVPRARARRRRGARRRFRHIPDAEGGDRPRREPALRPAGPRRLSRRPGPDGRVVRRDGGGQRGPGRPVRLGDTSADPRRRALPPRLLRRPAHDAAAPAALRRLLRARRRRSGARLHARRVHGHVRGAVALRGGQQRRLVLPVGGRGGRRGRTPALRNRRDPSGAVAVPCRGDGQFGQHRQGDRHGQHPGVARAGARQHLDRGREGQRRRDDEPAADLLLPAGHRHGSALPPLGTPGPAPSGAPGGHAP